MNRQDRFVLHALQAMALGLPFARGGNHPVAVTIAAPLVGILLFATLAARRQRGGSATPGLGALTAFVALGLATTLPLPASVLQLLDPATYSQLSELLPAWPHGGEWAAQRALAIDPYAVWTELFRLSIPLGAFAVVVGYPWSTDEDRRNVVTQLVVTLLAGGTLLALVGLCQLVIGNRGDARVSGPFVNPNHFAAWLEMTLPVAVGYLVTLLGRLRRVLARNLDTGRGMGMQRHRLWIEALVAQQSGFWAPLVVTGIGGLILAAHLATGSRGGTAALLVGVGVTLTGLWQRGSTSRSSTRHWQVGVIAAGAVLLSVVTVGRWALQDDGGGEAADVSLAARVAVAQQGTLIVAAHPLFGTGLGSWLPAYRRHQAPPVEYGIWDHAHNDFLEITSETGIIGLCLCLLFAAQVVRALRQPGAAPPTPFGDLGFGAADWWKDLSAGPGLRFGLAGGLAAILLHSLVDFSLRMPANLMIAALLTGLLVASTPRPALAPSRSLGMLTALLIVAATPLAANRIRVAMGATPLAPRECLERADLALAEGGDEQRRIGLELLKTTLDRSPTLREAHELLASTLPPGTEREAALERVIALQPWAPEARDQLALERWNRGDGAGAARDLEDSVARFPYLASHAVLLQSRGDGDSRAQVRRLADGNTAATRMAALDPALLDAVVRGLQRATAEPPAGALRTATTDDLIDLLEARNDWTEAAATLWAEAAPTALGATRLARAAQNYLRSGDRASAEAALLAALRQSPDQGDLYRMLAVDVYAALGDFPTAEQVLAAGQDNAVDMLPVYQGVTEVIARRERARVEQSVVADPHPSANARQAFGVVVVR